MEDDGDDKDTSKRKSRNLGEKKRRDQFNSLVTELNDLISNTNRKMDKSTILRSTISFLKNHNEVTVRSRAHDVQEDWKPALWPNDEFTYLVLEALEGFIMVFSTIGRIYYASESITSLLGHNPAEIVNKNIFDMMHRDDQQNLYNMLQKKATEHTENQSKGNEMILFQVHVQRGCLDFKEEVSYDAVQFYGHFRTNQEQDSERDVMDFRDVDSRVLFVCIGCLRTPKLIRNVSLVESTCSEFTSRHSLEWKFLFLDHRAPPIIGYLPFEVLGTSGYDYYHFDDLEKVVTCHEALMEKGELTSCYYRFLTKGQQWIWLQTRFYITYHQWNSKPEFVVCTHRVVSYADVINNKEELVELDTQLSESNNATTMKEKPIKDSLHKLSPPFNITEANNDACANAYLSMSQPESIKSASESSKVVKIAQAAVSNTDNWNRAQAQYTGGSDASLSGESHTIAPQRDSARELHIQLPQQLQPLQSLQTTKQNSLLSPQHGVGAEYLQTATSYATGTDPDGLLTLTATPPQAMADQAQIQEQLHLKHEELQQMIVRQQEELRQVKEQLALARLGILHPLINVPGNTYSTLEVLQNQEPNYSVQVPLPQLVIPTIPAQPPQQPHPDLQHMPQ